ncbi:MAG: hypothetical protein HN348_03740 [Proteobacteria bacterium]|jgi:DNA/RNA-binding domain of Phe-tRNA-synthetase-like protein|nr:hypothetical protein [Pseudomonadota bacterium]
MTTKLTIDPHPLLDLGAFVTAWPEPLGKMESPQWLADLARLDAPTPFEPPDEKVKKSVRDLLRHGGFKPNGRSKPCCEYIRAVAAKGLFPNINVAVDATNLAALHGALPVSTIDLDLIRGRRATEPVGPGVNREIEEPLRVGIAQKGMRYVFNASGQEIDLSGLLCLFDVVGPCANSVKDSQRAKTTEESRRTLTIIWGTQALPRRAGQLVDWHMELNTKLGGTVEKVEMQLY